MILSLLPTPRRWRGRAFTLIEVLVSMTVLTLLILAVSQMVSGTTSITTANRQHLDADGQARLVFDRMAFDFDRMLKRQDVDYAFKDASKPVNPNPQMGNDSFFFYSEAPAYFDNSATITATAQSPLALVGYRINPAGPGAPPQLVRLGKGLTWDGTPASGASTSSPGSIVYLCPSSTPSVNATPTPDPASTLAGRWPTTLGTLANGYSDGTDASYHVIADQVCRMETCFLLKPRPASGTAAAQPARYSVDPYYKYKVGASGEIDPLHGAVNGMQDVRAVVVALAILDRSSRQITPDLGHVSTALHDIAATDLAASPPVLMSKLWQDEIDGGTLAKDAQIPQAAASQLRIYQRHFYLDTN